MDITSNELVRGIQMKMKPSQWINKNLSHWHLINDYHFSGGVQVPRCTLFTLPEFQEIIEAELIPMTPAPVELVVKYVTKQELKDILEMTK